MRARFVCYAPIDLKNADVYIRDGYDNGANTPVTPAIEPISETIIQLSGMNTLVPDPADGGGVTVKFGSDDTEYTITASTPGAGVNEVQTIEIDDTVNGGTFTLSFGGQTTSALAYNASAAVVEDALEALSTIGAGNISVTGASPKWTATFAGDLAGTDVALMTGDGALLTGGDLTDVDIVETVTGVAAVNEVQTIGLGGAGAGSYRLNFGGDTTTLIAFDASDAEIELALEALDSIPQGEATVAPGADFTVTFSGSLGGQDVALMTVTDDTTNGTGVVVAETTPGVESVYEVQTVSINPSVTGGTFTLTWTGNTTVPLPYNCSAATMQVALNAAPVSAGVVVTGGPGPVTDWVVTFNADDDQAAITGTGTNLTGGATTTVVITELTKGVTGTGTAYITITPGLVVATTVSGSVTFGGRKLEIKVGEGNLTWTENRPRMYIKDRGNLDTVRDDDQEPVDVKFDFVWDWLTSVAGATPTIKEAIKQTGNAANWLTTSEDVCEPYCCDVEVFYDPNCGDYNSERVMLREFRYESLEHNLRDAQISCTGKCNVVEAEETRIA